MNVIQRLTENRTIRRSISVASLVIMSMITGGVTLCAQQISGVKILHSDATVLELLITPEVSIAPSPSGGMLPRVDGATIVRNLPGSPMELAINLPVGLPAPEGTRLEVLSVEYGEARFARIAPTPEIYTDDQGIQSERYVVDESLFQTYVPNRPAVEFSYRGKARGLDVGEITISPVRYTASPAKIEPVRSIHLRLRYGNAGPNRSGTPAPILPGLQGALLNGQVASNWSYVSTLPAAARVGRSTAARAWFRVEVADDGLYSILAEDFESAGINPSTISRVAVYGGRGIPLPESVNAAMNNRMNSVPTIIEKSGGAVQRVLFYGVGPNGWGFRTADANDSVPRHIRNPYVRKTSYIVAVDGDPSRDFPTQGNVGPATWTPSYGIGRFVFEDDLVNAIAQGNGGNGGGRDWFGPSFIVDEFRPEEKRVFTQELTGLDRSYPVIYRVKVATGPASSGTGSLEQNGQPVGTSFTIPWVAKEQATAGSAERLFIGSASQIPADNKSLLGVTYRNPASATGYLDWYELHYGRKFEAKNNRIIFESPTGPGVAEYRISGFNTNNLIGLDVTDPVNPIRLSPSTTNGGDFVFRDATSSSARARHRYFVGSPDDAQRVTNVSTVKFADLRGTPRPADVLVITSEALRPAAEAYASYRNSGGEFNASVFTTEEIYTEFSNGQLDPTAIRDFVSMTYHNWSKQPRYLLLFGDGHYDYRGIVSSIPQQVPVYTEGDVVTYADLDISVYDDYYARVEGEDFLIDLAPGRIPANSLQEASNVVDKIKQYEAPRSWGEWRDRILLVSDDRAPLTAGGTFVPQSEALEHDFEPEWMQTEKIYLPEYPTVNGSSSTKPGATQDLKQWLNRGVLLVNWVGHGNAQVWGHEHVLQKDELIPQLTNDSTLTMVMAVTCNFGRFDNPLEQAGGEMFLTKRDGGAAVVLATTRAVYINDNEYLMRAYFRSLFLRDPVTENFLPLGDALMATKIRSDASKSNDEKYVIFGDPSMRLNIPRDSIDISSVNVTDVNVDTVVVGALSLVTVEGAVRSRSGVLRSDFNGTVIVSLYDADEHKTLLDEGAQLAMIDHGGQLYRGPAEVRNGRFTTQFRVPKDITYDSTYTARLYAYAYNGTYDAAGGTRNIKVYGSDTTVASDGAGPDVTIFMDDRSFRSGDVVTNTPVLIVDLNDASGINASGAGLGHRIEAWIGDSPNPVDLTEYYTTSPTDFRSGSAEREILNLDPGEYRVRVRAWDIFNNPSEATAYFRILDGAPADLAVTDVVNYPNPMGKETEFLFRHNQTVPLDVRIDIYTPAGRKIRSLESNGVTDRFVRVPWDGRDTDGRRVANGVYFYKLRVTMPPIGETGSEQVIEVIEKVAVAQ